ncbi:hypothetical protein ACQPZQ_35570 [Pseudonocardia sp. CA-142604]|uniref:hypothetical protein n=1 Tax=Pseudonocardia sp. CA-142604 TaxID=3240024 RepID=UPI003D923C84
MKIHIGKRAVTGDGNEERLVREWRALQLQRLGLSQVLAGRFAEVVDWHEVAALVERGCPPDLALMIVC